jgi:hypothetical protein
MKIKINATNQKCPTDVLAIFYGWKERRGGHVERGGARG